MDAATVGKRIPTTIAQASTMADEVTNNLVDFDMASISGARVCSAATPAAVGRSIERVFGDLGLDDCGTQGRGLLDQQIPFDLQPPEQPIPGAGFGLLALGILL